MTFERVHRSRSQSPQSSWSTSQFAPRPFPVQEPKRPPTQEELENQAFQQNKFEATGLQLKEKYGKITPVEQERLGMLQAKMDSFWAQRMERANAGPNLLEILIRNAQSAQATEPAATVQPKLTIGQPNDQYEQEADRVAEQVMSMAPPTTSNVQRQARAVSLPSQDTSNSLQRRSTKANNIVTESSLSMTSQFVGSPPTFTSWGGGLMCKSPVFSAKGTVKVPAHKTDGDLTVGFMQALVSCTGPKGHYWDADNAPYMSMFATYSGLPSRDADANAGGIFYGPEAQNVIDSTIVSVTMADQPQTSLPWLTPDGKGRLQQIVGEHQFVTWLVVQSNSTGKIYPLRWMTWRVGWFSGGDQSMPNFVPFDFGMVTDQGEGQGPLTPIRSGPVANNRGQSPVWESWT